ncbi:serine hydrolase domain-containing protein [Microbacterium sp. ASV49]|uniref:Serine hydrolase domain-containing protein n=1 Tax=Microbacterium candidum TaxID=3041922 RepID=A0ABT7MTN7_9MICO|nr:serine hydrolase domain-containing protein [Microbacterium sp. ASV49]MDL9977812.1 serine hydrolase domain-containing protein [Microbacterium sp. ASV49]
MAAVAATVIALSLATAGCAPTPAAEHAAVAGNGGDFAKDTQKQLQDAVHAAMSASGASGAIVGVWAPWAGDWVEGLGTQSPTDKTAVTTAMDFRIADVTRAMTCDALYQVAADGTVDVDKPLSTYDPGYPDLGKTTLRQLCDGTAPIGSYRASLGPVMADNPTRQWDPHELVTYGLGQTLPAGGATAYHDSDAAYVLVGVILERVTGKTIAQILHDKVFAPLGLPSTALPGASASTPHTTGTALTGLNSVKGADGKWVCDKPADVTDASASLGSSAAGVVSDIDDLGAYVQALAKGTLTPKGSKRFASPQPVAAGTPSWYTAAGGAYQAGNLIGQFGAVPGYATAAFSDPATGLTVAVVLNNSGAGASVAEYLAWELAAIASKAPAEKGKKAPAAGLPWTAQQYADAIAQSAICAPPAK